MSAVKYQKLDPISHIHKRPDMYIGSLKPRDQLREWLADGEKIIEKTQVCYSDGLLRIFIEGLSNAIDNVWRSRQSNIKPTKIKITLNQETGETTIWNDGLHISIELHPEEKIYNPELIFGHLLSGSNLDDTEERLSSGRNGLGIKLLNVFSKEFSIEVADPVNSKLYTQSWKNNMRDMNPPKIKSYKNKMGYTMIRWIPDFFKFEMENYNDTIISLYRKFCMDAAMITHIPVFYNDEKFHYKNFADYVRLYMPSEETFKTELVSFSSDGGDTDSEYKTQIVIASSPTLEYKEIGFINGIFTKDGGVHLDNISSELWKNILPKFNKTKTLVSSKDLKPYFMIFVNAWAPNPEFNSQSKTKLLAPTIPIKLETKHLNTIMKWQFVEKIHDLIRSKEILSLKKTEKKQRGYKKIDGLDHANLAGTKHAQDCTLILCEGLSAKTYAIKGINVGWNDKKGRDYFGVYALRGKLLNVRNATIQSISNNREIADIIQALGIRYDADYSTPEGRSTLQYGRVMILTDADEDGHHICSLIINLFHKLFPTLLENQNNFLWYMMTPIAKIFYSGNKQSSFYNDMDYQRALEDQQVKRMKIKYYKGLGTSSDTEIKETFGQKVVSLVKDSKADETINKVFNKLLSHDRKDWLGEYDPLGYKVPEQDYAISDYINQELIKFSMEDCCRSIPNLFDGLKKSQRKILYSVFKKNLKHDGKSMKVAQLAGYCAENSNYHHGEQCLYDTITKMSQDFPGSNNVPYFEKDGQFGSLAYGGKDAANARYIFTKCAALTRLLFPEEDDALLNYTLDDGDKVEPDYYLPILPTILGNGCTAGIGTGWSCSVPCHDFLQLAEKVKQWLVDPESVDMDLMPSYNNFKGSIKKVEDNKFASSGILEEITQKGKKKGKIYQVTQLPIGVWTNRYKEELETMMEAKKLKSLKNYSSPDTVHFVFEPADDFTPTLENMKLTSTILTSNMVLFTETLKLCKFKTIEEIFQIFCQKRLELYGKRKEARIQQLQTQLLIDRNKRRFIREVDEDILKIFKVKEKTILENLVQGKYDMDPRVTTKKVVIESGQLFQGDEEEAMVEEDNQRSKKYHYLLHIPMKDVCSEKIEELDQKIQKLEDKLKQTIDTSDKEMWRLEIDEFVKMYSKN